MIKRIIIFICLLFVACPTDWFEDSPKQRLGEPFSLKAGETCVIFPENLKMGFQNVISDSRCPEGLWCKWEGVAELNVWLKLTRQHKVFIKSQIYGGVFRKNSFAQVSIDTLGYKITLRQLDPYPKHDITNDYSNYVAEFVVTKD